MEDSQHSLAGQAAQKGCSMASSFPVLLPEDPCLTMDPQAFDQYILDLFPPSPELESAIENMDIINSSQSTAETSATSDDQCVPKPSENTFVNALEKAASGVHSKLIYSECKSKNRALTENNGMTFASTESALVDLFHIMDGEWSTSTQTGLADELDQAWKEDPLACLKLIWNTRSIHLGKGNRHMFYIAMGWLKEHHPRTLLTNLQWLFRPVVEKNAKPSKDKETVPIEKTGSTVDDHGVIHGVAHGYWKDLLNILVLSANGKLDMSDPRELLLTKGYAGPRQKSKFPGRIHKRQFKQRSKHRSKVKKLRVSMTAEEWGDWQKLPLEDRVQKSLARDQQTSLTAREQRHANDAEQHKQVLDRLSNNPFHRALHLTVARLFAEKLQKDMLLVGSGTAVQQKEVTLCGKWAPSLKKFHDKHTLIATSIAEILFPADKIGRADDTREMYLKRAREQYRFWTTSKLRKVLQCVECDISANTFSNIKYNRVPSLAMDQYKDLFAKKDDERFRKYLDAVEQGKAKISGAVLAPGSLVSQAVKVKSGSVTETVVNMQWQSLVQRIRDCGSLSSSMALCDVSGSMLIKSESKYATLMDIAIGLSLIVSEVTQPPFGGKLITFSKDPRIINIGGPTDSRTFKKQIDDLRKSEWGFNTDFIRVFELILGIAVSNKVAPEDMIKRLFVFSDMEFDEATGVGEKWDTHHQIITKSFADAGYEMPELVYWNLSNRPGRHAPVTHDTPGAALVSGHSQAMIKVFLDTGSLDVEEEDTVDVEMEDEWGVVEVTKKKKEKMTPYSLMMKAIGNKAYEMLTVVD